MLCNQTIEWIKKPAVCPILYSKNGNFVAEEVDDHVEFECLWNFHYVSGSKTRFCMDDGQWSGEDFHCEVDYYMERYKLSSCIVLTALSLSMIFFGTDLIFYVRKRHERRRENRLRMDMYLKYNSFDASVNLDDRKQFHRLLAYNPDKAKETRVKSVREYHRSSTSFPVSPQGSTYYESTPKDVWFVRSMLKMHTNVDMTNNQPAGKGPLDVPENVPSERIHLPIAPDLGYQGIRLFKPTIRYDQFYREEEVLGFGREILKRKKVEKPEHEKPQKRKFLMAMNIRKRSGSDAHDLNISEPKWTQREGRKRKHLGTL